MGYSEGIMGSYLIGTEFVFQMKRILEIGNGDGCTTIWIQYNWTIYFKMVTIVNFMLSVLCYNIGKKFKKSPLIL